MTGKITRMVDISSMQDLFDLWKQGKTVACVKLNPFTTGDEWKDVHFYSGVYNTEHMSAKRIMDAINNPAACFIELSPITSNTWIESAGDE